MKTILLTLLLLLGLPVLAKSESPVGLFQVDSTASRGLTGLIHIDPVFPDSKINFESGDTLFEAQEIQGALVDFSVKGILRQGDSQKTVTLQRRTYGVIDREAGQRRLALKLSNDQYTFMVFALQPTTSATALHKEVQDIFQ